MAHNPDPDQHKRKRNDDDNGGQGSHAERIPQPPPPQPGHPKPINYLSKANPTKLSLIQGDGEIFSGVLTLINEYEGVLSRHESLASNLGAKLAGPRLLKAMEGAFEGSIKTNPLQTLFTHDSAVTWLDIVEFARSNPSEFKLTNLSNGTRSCQFSLNGLQVEITEDDWRMIVSGALDRFRLVPAQPLEEDETAELATLEILEQRLQFLIKRADEVARKARQLNYQLSGRRATINGRRSSQQTPSSSSGSGFLAVNQPGRGPNPSYDLRDDLIRQFGAPNQSVNHRISSISSVPPTPNNLVAAPSIPKPSVQQQVLTTISNRPSPSYHPEPAHKDLEEEYRALIMARVEKLGRGDVVYPPCDRCRRLKTSCIKHLTACQGCTKKHARCVWKGLTEDEVAWLKGEAGEGDDDGDEPRESRPGSFSRPASQPEQGEPRRDSDRSEDADPRSRIIIGRHVDDIWRKGPGTSSRHDSMEIDPRDTREQHRHTTELDGTQAQRPREHSLLYMTSMAAAAVDTTASTRESPRGS